MEQIHLERRVRWLTRYALVSSFGLLVVVASGFRSKQEQRFTEIVVERINVMEPDGRLAMVIANEARLPGNIIGDREWGDRQGVAGMLFYDGKGDETGELTYGSRDDDSTFWHSVHLSFDQYNNDQVLVADHGTSDQGRFTVLRFVDRTGDYTIHESLQMQELVEKGSPEERERARRWLREHTRYGESWGNRVILGSLDRVATLQLNDTRARPRIRLTVDSLDVARMEFLDADGTVVFRLPEER